jgi:glutamyl/glutaminyl-tRNA synthetase
MANAIRIHPGPTRFFRGNENSCLGKRVFSQLIGGKTFMPLKRPNYTRFNPTTNGPLHIGHLYMILVNEAEAHATEGGKFIIRFDDTQEAYLYGVSWDGHRLTANEIIDVKNHMAADLDWLGIKVDEWQSQITMEVRMRELLDHLTGGVFPPVRQCYTSQMNPEMHWCNFDVGYPYFPQLTAEKVLYDFLSGSNLLIRGDDLLDEWSLYNYFCDIWGMPMPRQVFLKRLQAHDGAEFLDVSKTRGGNTIRSFKEAGWRPEQLIESLAYACLIDPEGPWLIDNLKQEPKIPPLFLPKNIAQDK